jgi:hypothetical protein
MCNSQHNNSNPDLFRLECEPERSLADGEVAGLSEAEAAPARASPTRKQLHLSPRSRCFQVFQLPQAAIFRDFILC